jgi:hypothetical protein
VLATIDPEGTANLTILSVQSPDFQSAVVREPDIEGVSVARDASIVPMRGARQGVPVVTLDRPSEPSAHLVTTGKVQRIVASTRGGWVVQYAKGNLTYCSVATSPVPSRSDFNPRPIQPALDGLWGGQPGRRHRLCHRIDGSHLWVYPVIGAYRANVGTAFERAPPGGKKGGTQRF